MTAGRGIVHSEMPEQEEGLLEGFQLWVNLPAEHKMDEPAYQEHPADQIPTEQRKHGEVRVIAGTTSLGTRGPVVQPLTEPLYLDVSLGANGQFRESLPGRHNAFVYMIQGQVNAPDQAAFTLKKGQLGVMTIGHDIELNTGDRPARFLLVAGKPLNEPVARGGPFVMNTREEIQQAFDDYKSGLL
jgi:redox-sensitive bicupin YhaK (pirin superfamily)